ncbi:hypothetical protein [[Enterobacter] lignolyticus]|uniref:hypothetical protein n=1 Tax=[Enterobacter] lignolyticus TaxID=1334193 RepID=UPI000A92FDEA|nr:hypothetical protein [[Enterobacter] lignolyticus]
MKCSNYDVFILSRDVFVRYGLYHLCIQWHLSSVFSFNKTTKMEAAVYRSLLLNERLKRRVVIISFECGDDGPEELPYLLERLKKFKSNVEIFLLMPLLACRFKLIYKSCNGFTRFLCKKDSLLNLNHILNESQVLDIGDNEIISFSEKEKNTFFNFLNNPHLPYKNRKAYMSDYVTFTRIAKKLGITNRELRDHLYRLNLDFILNMKK